jgi:tyrosinase
MVYRQAAGDVAAPATASLIDAMRRATAISDNRGYNWIAGFHGAPGWYCWHHQVNRRTPVQARLFLPWHRAYLWWLEQALQDQVEGAALVWWDWTAVPEIPPGYAATSADGEPNPLRSTRAFVPTASPPIDHDTRRDPGANPLARLPRTSDLITNDPSRPGLLEDGDFASFSDRLEDLHDHVHGWVGGDMGDPATAAFDPVFFAHHCMIDRLWYLWQNDSAKPASRESCWIWS